MSTNLRNELLALLQVQEVDTRLDKVRIALAALDSGTQIAAQYNKLKTEADAMRAVIAKAHGEQKDAELKLASLETKRQQVEMSMMQAGVAPRELENLQKELEMIERQRESAEETALFRMDNSGETDAKANVIEKKMAGFADEYRKIRSTYKEQHTILAAEIATIEKEKAIVVAPVPAALLKTLRDNSGEAERYRRCAAQWRGLWSLPHPHEYGDGTCRPSLRRGADVRILWKVIGTSGVVPTPR